MNASPFADPSAKATDPSAVVIPFGKHKGRTVAELLATDPQYTGWLLGQAWVAERLLSRDQTTWTELDFRYSRNQVIAMISPGCW
jgi:hypothetical protein